jgi:two-component system response regulator CpxR
MSEILIVDDDVELCAMLREYLELEGFSVEAVHDGASCFDRKPETKDLIVLDVMLPSLPGFEVLKRLRQFSQVPVIMLTARDDPIDRIVGFEIGADDYVSKPVNPRELVGRIRAVLRRTATHEVAPAELVVGDVTLNPTSRTAWVRGEPVDLTSAEFTLLEHMLLNAGRIISRDDLSATVFGRRHSYAADRNVDTLVSKVRRKLDPDGALDQRIKTVRNVGYIFAKPAVVPPNAASILPAREARSPIFAG